MHVFLRCVSAFTLFILLLGGAPAGVLSQEGGTDAETFLATLPFLSSEPSEIHVGREFTILLEHAPRDAAAFGWDLHTDGSEDAVSVASELRLIPDAPGILPVRVILRDAAGSAIQTVSAEFIVLPKAVDSTGSGMMLVEEEIGIIAEITGYTVRFSPDIKIPLNINRLQPEWSFGDEHRSFLFTPSHEYAEPGTYRVRLDLRDLENATIEKTAEAMVTITAVVTPVPDGESNSGSMAALGGLFLRIIGFIFKVFFLILLLVVLLLGVAGIVFLVVWRRERMTFHEAVLFFHRKIAAFRGKTVTDVPEVLSARVVEATEHTVDKVAQVIHPEVMEGKREEAPVALMPEAQVVEEMSDMRPQTSDVENQEKSEQVSAPLAATEGPVPAWLQTGVEQGTGNREEVEKVEEKEGNEETSDMRPQTSEIKNQVVGEVEEAEEAEKVEGVEEGEGRKRNEEKLGNEGIEEKAEVGSQKAENGDQEGEEGEGRKGNEEKLGNEGSEGREEEEKEQVPAPLAATEGPVPAWLQTSGGEAVEEKEVEGVEERKGNEEKLGNEGIEEKAEGRGQRAEETEVKKQVEEPMVSPVEQESVSQPVVPPDENATVAVITAEDVVPSSPALSEEQVPPAPVPGTLLPIPKKED